MSRICLAGFLILPAILFPIACQSRENSPAKPTESGATQEVIAPANPVANKGSRPVPPLNLAEPPELSGKFNGIDFQDRDAGELFDLGRDAADKGQYNLAAIAQYWYCRKAKKGYYDLACYLSRIGQVEPAFYWLQKAAIEDGVDSRHAQRDQDLVSLRSDARWNQVLNYTGECNRYFETANIVQTLLVLPKDYNKTKAIPALVWLHGLGSGPGDFVNGESQEYADRLNIALIGVSGTKARGPRSFVWAEDIEQDARRIRAALAEVGDRVTIAKGKVITLGFSQGAQVGLEVAVQYPEEFAGSIVLSPGAEPHLESIQPSPLLAHRGFVISCGANEHPGNVYLAKEANDWLRRARAPVIYKAYPNVSAHSFPADFDQRFPEWIQFILGVK